MPLWKPIAGVATLTGVVPALEPACGEASAGRSERAWRAVMTKRNHLTKLAVVTLLLLVASASLAESPSAGCGTSGPGSGVYSIEHGGLDRSYRLYLPAGYTPDDPTRLVLVFHGWGGNENEFLSDPVVRAEADARGHTLVAPRGLGSGPPDNSFNSWSFRGSTTGLDGDGVNPLVDGDTAAICDEAGTPDYTYGSCEGIAANSCSWTHCQADDVAFALALIDSLAAELCIDLDNVFATGGSNGGMFSWELGQNPVSAPAFRAIAPVIGLPHRAHLNGPGRPGGMPVLLITGSRDPTVPPGPWRSSDYTTTSDGDLYHYTGATGIIRSWSAAQGCDTTRASRPFDDGVPQTQCRTFCSPDVGWPRVLDCRAMTAHDYELVWAWPLVLEFFDRHSIE